MSQTVFALILVRIIFRLVSGAVEWTVVPVVGVLMVGRWLARHLWRGMLSGGDAAIQSRGRTARWKPFTT